MRAWLPVVLTLPFALAGCPAVLSDWKISRSGGTDASVDAAGPDGAGSSSGTGSGGSSGSSGGSSSGGVAGAGREPNTAGGTSAGGFTGTGGATNSGGAFSTGGAKGGGGSTAGSGGASNDSGLCVADLSGIQTGDFHISFDVLSTKGAGPLLEQRAVCDPYSVDWIIAEQSTYDIIVQIGDGSNYVNLQSVATVNDGVWHHVVVARVSATLSITIDGHLDNSIPNGGLSLGPLALLQVGRSACTTPFGGQIKDVCLTRS